MSKLFDSSLFNTARHTFENLAFILSLEEGDGGTSLLVAPRSVTVDFTGPVSGCLVVSVSSAVLPEIATNMLGLDGTAPSQAQQQDAFKELANVICGNLLPALAGTHVVFSVSAPVLIAGGETPDATMRAPVGLAHLTLENGAAELALYVNENSGCDLATMAAAK